MTPDAVELLDALDTELAAQPANPPFRPIRAADWGRAALVAERNGYHAYTVAGDGEWATLYLVRLGGAAQPW